MQALWRLVHYHIWKWMEKMLTPESLNGSLVALEGSTVSLPLKVVCELRNTEMDMLVWCDAFICSQYMCVCV